MPESTDYAALLTSEVGLFATEYAKFKSGNKTAAARARKHCQNLKTIAQAARQAIQEEKNTGTPAVAAPDTGDAVEGDA